ncbi:MarR family winged helix-turn-helix transcriptional regulator [Streptacidiphilus sp. MAP5-3]|uniref:MarR family winged helix-turn-helix transcriptional regulator n=1 Tax=unclassified Streptacidiphilus TaxID=2643834 RepID=UPI0035146EB2
MESLQPSQSTPPMHTPTGLQLGQAARVVSRAFDDALERAGGSLPVWLILLNLKIRRPGTQRELAQAVGLREATLTHHLNALDKRGLISRHRDPDNRRIHVVSLTEEGEAAFLRMREVATAFDERLNDGLTDLERGLLADLLRRLTANVEGEGEGAGEGVGEVEGPSES